MTHSNLQRVVVLCLIIVMGVYGGIRFAELGVKHGSAQIDPPSLNLDAGPSDTSTDEVPDVSKPLEPNPAVTSFEECAAAGNPIMESYPAKCIHNGVMFVQEITEPIPEPNPIACTADAKMCADGSYVGRVGPNCEFAKCPTLDEGAIVCTDEQKQASMCTMEYAPVCGQVEVQCITTPCDPVPQTFSNGCSACSQGNVSSYVEGACEE